MDLTKELRRRLKDNSDLVPDWLVENLGSYLDNQLDEYSQDPTNDSVSTLCNLQELSYYSNPTYQKVIQEAISITKEYIENSAEKKEVENFIGMNNIVNNKSTEICSDADFFSALHQKGIVTDDVMQKHRTSQFYALVSTFSNLIGEERKGRAYGPTKTPPVPLQDWLDEWEYLEARNRELCNGDLSAIGNKSDKELIRCLKFHTEKLPLSISNGTYDDMCTNAVICYTFMVLAAGVVQWSKDTDWNETVATKKANQVLHSIEFCIKTVGCNTYMVLGAMLLLIIYQRMLAPFSIILSDKYANAFANAFDKDNYKIPNQRKFSSEMRIMFSNLEKDYGVCLTKEDSVIFQIPKPFLFTWWEFAEVCNRKPVIWEELKDEALVESLKEPCRQESKLPKTMMEAMDSLVSGFQVESGVSNDLGLMDFTVLELHQALSKQQTQMIQQIVRGNFDAVWEIIATNIVIGQELTERMKMDSESGMTSADCSNLGQELFKMDYQNKKYIGIAEAAKPDVSIQEYAASHKKQLLAAFREKCNKT